MAVSNGTSEPDERTALLNGSVSNSVDSSHGDAIKPSVNRSADEDGSKRGISDCDEADEEAGDAAEENPLFEGNAEMRKKLHLLFPAVVLGVRLLGPFVLPVSIIRHEALISTRSSSSRLIKPSSSAPIQELVQS